jgi:hypothetical protein
MNKLTQHDLSLIVVALANDADRCERDNFPNLANQIRHTLFKVQAQLANAERRAKREAKKAAAALDDFNYVGSRHHY